jgi:glycosyltransferase involved in cell wall biosynthesis
MTPQQSAPQRDCRGTIDRVVVIHDYATAEGGAGVLALLAAREYRKAGLPVTFFAGGYGGAGGDLDGIDIVSLGGRDLLSAPRRSAMLKGLYNRAARDALDRWIERYDTPGTVYHLHNWSQILSPAIFDALRAVESRTVVTCHDFFNVCPNGSFVHYGTSEPCDLRPLSAACLIAQCDRRSAVHKYWRTARQLQLNRAARFARSRATFTVIHRRMQERLRRAGFAVADLRAIPNPAEPWARQRIVAENNARLLFVGRVGPDKGADLAAAAACAAGVPLTVIGAGELASEIAARFPDVSLRGWCDRQEIAAAAGQARALIVPSRVIEPFGLVILEAAMSGLPVLVSDRAYLAPDAEREGFGIAFDPADAAALARQLSRIARDDEWVAGMSQAGFSRAAAHAHSASSWANEFVGIFREKLEKNRSGRPTACMPHSGRPPAESLNRIRQTVTEY